MNERMKKLLQTASLAAILGFTGSAAYATEGMFGNGNGARQKALAGAGVADSRDATAQSLNPAGLVHVNNQLTISASLFSPHRKYSAGGGSTLNAALGNINSAFTPTGSFDSDQNMFIIPNMAWSYRLDGYALADVIGFTLYGNGGMNTHYPDTAPGSQLCSTFAASGFPITGTGTFCNSLLGINYSQALFAMTMAKKLGGGISVGISPTIARQQIEIDAGGLTAFGLANPPANFFGYSIDPAALTGRGTDVSWGYGLRAGIEVDLGSVRIGLAGATKTYMSKFDKYRGLFEDQGRLDIPASTQIGVAVDVTPTLTLMADWRHIFYSDVPAIGNSSTLAASPSNLQFGQTGGPGFGWEDVDTFKFGIEWDATPNLTLRAGYSYNTQPVQSKDVMFNIIAPAVVQHHITAGAKVKLMENLDLELTGMFAPEGSVSGGELALAAGNFGLIGDPTQNIEISMYQYEITAGIVWHMGQPEAPLK